MSEQELLTPANAKVIDDTFGRHIGVKDTDARRLAWLAAQIPAGGVIVEIGSFWGRSAGYMASAMPEGATLFCVDRWPNMADMNKFRKNIARIWLSERVAPLRGDSVEVSQTWDKPIDLLYIDGNHTYAGVRNDFHSYAPFVKHGGLIAFHDYGAKSWPGVKHFVDETVTIDFDKLGVHQLIWSGRKR